MRRTFTFISVIALVMTMLALPATADTPTTYYTGQGMTADGPESEKCDPVDLGHGSWNPAWGDIDEVGYLKWVFNQSDSDAVILSGPWGTVSMTKVPGEGSGTFHAVTPYYDLVDLVPSKVSVNSTGGQLVVSNGCPGDEPLTTAALLSGVKSQDALLPAGTALSGWAISILQWVDGAYVLVPPVGAGTNPVLTGADGAWSFQTPTVVVDDPDDVSTYYVCEEQRAGWTQLYPVFDAEADPQTMIQIPGRGTCYIVEVGVGDEPVPNLNFVNEITPGRVDIVKVDEAGNPLANITFSLTRTVDDAKVYDQTCVTNALGQCSFLNVPVATGYVLDEVNGYELGDVFLGDPTDPANLITLPHTFDVAMGTAPATGSLYTFTVENLVGQWCSPGYWRQAHHFGNWPAPYSPTTLVPADIIALYQINQRQLTRSGLEDGPYTLIDVLNHPEVFGGAAFNAIGDLLSGAHTEVNFLGNRVEGSCPLGRAPSA